MEMNNKLSDYLHALKNAGPFSYEDIANLSGVPHQTVRNIYTGKTPDPRFATVAQIIISLGGDLNEIIGGDKKKEIEVNSMVSLKETYEMRIADLIKSYEERIEDVKAFCEVRVADTKKACEVRLADMRMVYDERVAELKEMLLK